jgi:hypothetical protein
MDLGLDLLVLFVHMLVHLLQAPEKLLTFLDELASEPPENERPGW